MDFLSFYDLLVDPSCGRILHRPSATVTPTEPSGQRSPLLTHLRQATLYDALIADFPLSHRSSPTRVDLKVRHSIATTGPPCFAHPRRLPPERPFDSCWASPLQMVPKAQHGEWMVCGDYRALNTITQTDCYPIPHVLDFHSMLPGPSVVSKIDLLLAFH